MYMDMMDPFSEIHAKHGSTLCKRNVEFFSVKMCGTYSNH